MFIKHSMNKVQILCAVFKKRQAHISIEQYEAKVNAIGNYYTVFDE